MSATIEIGSKRATIDGYQWICDDKRLETELGALLDPNGPSGADPDPDYHAAQLAIEKLGGRLVDFEPTEYEEGRVY